MKTHRLLRLAERVVDGAHGLEILNVGLELGAYGRRYLLNLREGLLVAARGVKRS